MLKCANSKVILVTVQCIILTLIRNVRSIGSSGLESNGTSDFTAIFSDCSVNTIIPLKNESIFYHIEADLNDPNTLIAGIDNAVARIDLRQQSAAAYSGLLTEAGYVEGTGVQARYDTVISLAQTNQSTIIVADKNNFCLRQLDRSRKISSTFAGRCKEQSQRLEDKGKTTANDIRLVSPNSLLYDNRTQLLYLADLSTVYVINIKKEVNQVAQDNSITIYGLATSTVTNHILFGTAEYSIITIDTNNQSITVIAGDGLPLQTDKSTDGDFTDSSFNMPRAMIHLSGNLYMVTEYKTGKLRGLDMTSMKTYSLCGTEVQTDKGISTCQLYQPRSLALVDHILYIGERGTVDGGIKAINCSESEEPSRDMKHGVIVLTLVGTLLVMATSLIILARWYTAKVDRDPTEDPCEMAITTFNHLNLKLPGVEGAPLAAEIKAVSNLDKQESMHMDRKQHVLEGINEDSALETINADSVPIIQVTSADVNASEVKPILSNQTSPKDITEMIQKPVKTSITPQDIPQSRTSEPSKAN